VTSAGKRTIEVDYLARVEGEGALDVEIVGDRVERVALRIFEPPRYFEAMLRGRRADEAPDITARICGICPVAYQMSACHAVEDAWGMRVDGQLRELRRLLYCGEWIESHVLHMTMLHAPDFLGAASVVELAEKDRPAVERALRLKKCGNRILRVLGGREIHPVNVRVGGFHRVPRRAELGELREDLARSRDEAVELARWAAGFDFPELERDFLTVSLAHPDEYPLNEGRIVAADGLDIPVADYGAHFREEHVAYSTALHSTYAGRSYFVGPMARYRHCRDRLPAWIRDLAAEIGLGPVCANPFRSILVRAIEVVFAFDEALRVVDDYEPPPEPFVAPRVRAGVGHGATEAPRSPVGGRSWRSAAARPTRSSATASTSSSPTASSWSTAPAARSA